MTRYFLVIVFFQRPPTGKLGPAEKKIASLIFFRIRHLYSSCHRRTVEMEPQSRCKKR